MDNNTDIEPFETGIYQGTVSHKRFSPKHHEFAYQISMLGIVLDELDEVTSQHKLFGTQWFNPVQFNEKDYIKSEPGCLKERIASKVRRLGGEWDGHKVLMIAQCRCLGIYFSPVNFFYCFDKNEQCVLMLAEVSNTPWNERHYYLVNLENSNDPKINKKDFHVSPFMELSMNYHWHINSPSKKVFINIQNFTLDTHEKVFEANMKLTKRPLKTFSLIKSWLTMPFTIVRIVTLIYWQATKLYLKRIPIVDKAN